MSGGTFVCFQGKEDGKSGERFARWQCHQWDYCPFEMLSLQGEHDSMY